MAEVTQPSPRSFWDKFWRDKHGKVVIYQRPNWLIISGLVGAVICWFSWPSPLKQILMGIDGILLAVWASQELFQGVNYFRRTLGATVLIGLVVGALWCAAHWHTAPFLGILGL